MENTVRLLTYIQKDILLEGQLVGGSGGINKAVYKVNRWGAPLSARVRCGAHTQWSRERELPTSAQQPERVRVRVRDDGFPVQKEKGFQREGRSGIRHVEGTRWLGFWVRVWDLTRGT